MSFTSTALYRSFEGKAKQGDEVQEVLKDPFWNILGNAANKACKYALKGVCGKGDQTTKRDPFWSWLASAASKMVCKAVVSSSF